MCSSDLALWHTVGTALRRGRSPARCLASERALGQRPTTLVAPEIPYYYAMTGVGAAHYLACVQTLHAVPPAHRGGAWESIERIPVMIRPIVMLRTLLVASLLSLGVASQASAANSAFADTSKPVTFLKETVVTGARYPRAYYESPQALSFLSRTQLGELAPRVIGDALQSLPGVDNSKDSPWEQRVVLRGLSGQRVLVLQDGMPMNSARGNGPHPSLVPTGMIDRVEVVRGPSSVSYGSDAIGGALNIITRDALPAADGRSSGINGSAQVGGSSADHMFGGQAELHPYVGKLGLLVTGGWNKAQDFETPKATVANSAYKDWNGAVNARYDLNRHLILRTGYQAYRGNDIGIPGLSFAFPGASQDFSFRYYDRDLVHVTLDQHYPDSWLENTQIGRAHV